MTPVIAVFTAKSRERILTEGGTSAWKLHPRRAREYQYAVCTRSGADWVEDDKPKGSAFLVGRISAIADAPDNPGRHLIRFSDFANIDVPDVWQGWRNPVRYSSVEELGIDLDDLEFQPMPDLEDHDDELSTEQVKAEHGEKMIEVKLRFWTNDIAEGKDNIVPKHAWSGGVVRIESNKSHGIVPAAPIPFHSMLDVGRAIEKCLIDQDIVLHPSTRMQKYTA